MFIAYVTEKYKTKDEAELRISILDLYKDELNISGDWRFGILSGWHGYDYNEEEDTYIIRFEIHCTDEEKEDLIKIQRKYSDDDVSEEETEYAREILRKREEELIKKRGKAL